MVDDAITDDQSHPAASAPTLHAVSLDGDPETVAEQLIAPTLWATRLDDIDLSTEQGQADVMARFIIRKGKASIEKDELIRFVEKNRTVIPSCFAGVLDVMVDAAKATDDGEPMAAVMQHFRDQVNHAYRGEYEKIQTRSDRLFWLIYVLGAQLAHQQLSYDAAVGHLLKQPHRDRMTSSALMFMVVDCAESVGEINQPATEMLMLIGQAACIINDEATARAALRVVLKLGKAGHSAHLLEYIRRMETHLADRGGLDEQDRDAIKRVVDRFGTNIPPEDF